MREGPTLIPALLPDTRGCILEQPLVMPARSTANTCMQFVLLFLITVGFDLFLEHIAFLVFLALLAVRLDRVNPKNLTQHSGDLLVTFVVYKSIVPFFFCPIALALVLYQAVLFTQHWVYLLTASPCSLEDARRVRAELRSTLPMSIAVFPLTAVWGAYCLCGDIRQGWAAWRSYLNYGKGGPRAAGIFHSPAGSHRFRMRLFYITGAALSLSILHVPIPFLALGSSITLAIATLLLGPALLAIFVPLLVVSPHFETLRRVRRGA